MPLQRTVSAPIPSIQARPAPPLPTLFRARSPEPELGTWKCAICLEDKPSALERMSQVCGRSECSGGFCSDCLSGYFGAMVEGSKFMALPVRCPAEGCRRRVPTAAWGKLVSVADRQGYDKGAEAILSFRCPNCDDTKTMLVEAIQDESERQQRLASVLSCAGPKEERSLRKCWASFRRGVGSGEDVLDALEAIFMVGVADLLAPDEEGSCQLASILELIPDVERRCVLHLTALRRAPKIFTPCCQQEFCWNCKIADHHPDMTCEELQRQSLTADIQFCPSCKVATTRSEGCDHMVCLCGEEWTWKGGDDDEEE